MERFAEHIAHVDMDAFFVEVERCRRPELRAEAVVVAGLGGRGAVTSASYEARRCGVASGMPTVHARRLCPQARFLAPDHRAYSGASREVFAVFASFTPVVEPVSVDEAFLDIAGLRLSYSSPEEVGVGGAGGGAGAHRAAGFGGAGGQQAAGQAGQAGRRSPTACAWSRLGERRPFCTRRRVRAMWGVGEATHARLEELGVRTVGDLAALPRDLLERRLGQAVGGHLSDLAHARDEWPVEPGGPAKSISVEETFAVDLAGRAALEEELLRLADRLAGRLRTAGTAAHALSVQCASPTSPRSAGVTGSRLRWTPPRTCTTPASACWSGPGWVSRFLPEQRLPSCIDELKRLAEELYLPDAAITPLDITFLERCIYARFEFADLINGSEVEILSEHKGPDHLHKLSAEFLISCYRAGAQEHCPFPFPAPGFVIHLISSQRKGYCSALTLRPQPQIDPVHKPCLSVLGKEFGKLLSDLAVILMIRYPVCTRAPAVEHA